MKAEEIIIPIKFYMYIIQLILSTVAHYTINNNINSEIIYYKEKETILEYNNEYNYYNNIFVTIYVIQTIIIITIISSINLFFNKLSLLSIVLSLYSNLCLCWFIWQKWIANKILISLIIGNVLPLILEIIGILYIIYKKKGRKNYKFFN